MVLFTEFTDNETFSGMSSGRTKKNSGQSHVHAWRLVYVRSCPEPGLTN
jgi:hypothetical protein